MQKTSLITSLYQTGCIQLGEFLLKNGSTSSVYINLRKIISYPDVLRAVASAMWEKMHGQPFELLCGVPYTALPIATCFSLQQNIPMIMRRKEKKEYGMKQSIEGEFEAGQICLVIEDIITSGSSILETARDLQQAGLQIHDVIALIDRQEGGKQNLSQHFRTHTLLTLTEILQTLLTSHLLDTKEQKLIETFLAEKVAV